MRWVLLWFLMMAVVAGEAPSSTTREPVITVTVSDLQNRHPLLNQDWLSSALADLIGSALGVAARDSNGRVTVLDRTAIASLEQESRLTGGNGTAQGAVATHVLGGSFIVEDDHIVLEVALAANGQPPTWTQRLEGSTAQVSALAGRIAAGALASLSLSVSPSTGVTGRSRDLPLAALVTFQRGKAAASRGDHAWALADLLRTCKLAPNFGEAWLALGLTCEALGRPAAALAAWEQAVTVDPDDPAMPCALFRLARAQEDHPERAARLYERLIAEYPYSPAPLELTGPLANGQKVTLADLAGKRLAGLVDRPAVMTKPSSTVDATQSGPATVVNGSSAGAALVEMRQRQVRQVVEQRARGGYNTDADGRYRRQALLSAAGGWPDGMRVVRVQHGVPVQTTLTYEGLAIAPPDGQAIEQLTFNVVPRDGTTQADYRFQVYLESPRCLDTVGTLLAKTPDGQPVTAAIPPNHALGFYAVGSVNRLRQKNQTVEGMSAADLQLTAVLRPVRPGSMWITTQPSGVMIKVDGVERGVTPCRIADLPVGQVALSADSMVAKTSYGNDNPVQQYLHFRGETAVTIAPQGETRVAWTLAQDPSVVANGWSPLRLALPAPLNAEVPGITVPFGERPFTARSCLAEHPRAGLVSVWSMDGDLYLSTSRDSQVWSTPVALASNSGADERVLGLAVSPTGQTVIAFRRERDLLVVSSEDLRSWTAAVKVSEIEYESDQGQAGQSFTGLQWNAAGHWMMLFRISYDRVFTAQSTDGRAWVTSLCQIPETSDWFLDGCRRLMTFTDGSPALVMLASPRDSKRKERAILRFALDAQQHWALRDQSSGFPRERVWESDTALIPTGDQVVDLVTRSGKGVRWNAAAGPAVELVDGLALYGTSVATVTRPTGAVLMTSWAGSWWTIERGGSPPMPTKPQVTYEVPLPAAAASATPVTSSAESTPVAPRSPPAAPASESATDTAKPNEDVPATAPVRRGRSLLTTVLVLGGVLVITGGLTWWWWGFLRRRREEAQP